MTDSLPRRARALAACFALSLSACDPSPTPDAGLDASPALESGSLDAGADAAGPVGSVADYCRPLASSLCASAASIPRTSAIRRNWSTMGLNDFRRNVQGDLEPLAGPDLTIGRGACAASTAVLTAEVCNRGAEPVDSGTIASFFDGDPRAGGTAICEHATTGWLRPGDCEEVSCAWPAPKADPILSGPEAA